MTRAPRRAAAPSRPVTPKRPKRRAPWAAGAVALVVLAGIAAVMMGSRGRDADRRAAPRVSGAGAPAESVSAHLERGDRVFVIEALEDRLPATPRDPVLLRALSELWQDHARASRDRDGVPIPATRTSLERIARERRALMFADSARLCARSTREQALAWGRRAEIMAGLGLPIDALDAYRHALAGAPDQHEYALRVAAYEAFLRDPTHPQRVVVPAPAVLPGTR